MITEAFDNIEYSGNETADLIRDYKVYIDRVTKDFRLGFYNVSGGDRPDLVAYKLYGNPNLYWLILYLNNITDPFHEWAKEANTVFETTEQKYKDMGGVDQIAYLRDINGDIYYDLVPHPDVPTNWYHKGDVDFRHIQYAGILSPVPVNIAEGDKNDSLRSIKVVDPDDIKRYMDALHREVMRVKGLRNA